MKHSFNTRSFGLAVLAFLVYAPDGNAQSNEVPPPITVSLPGDRSVEIQIDNYENPEKNDGNKALLTVHGLGHTGATFEPLAKELFKKTGSDKVDRVLALNFPGRNGSGLPPSDLEFGSLSVEDYTAVLLGVLNELTKEIKIESILGHSMGALIIQTAQNTLVSNGTSLEREYGIKNVYLLAPSIPNPLPWLFADSGAAAAIAEMLVPRDPDPILGPYLRLLSSDHDEQTALLNIWFGIFFTNRVGEFAPDTPSSTTALESGYISNEALVVTLQSVGANGFVRPWVIPGIFASSVQKCFRIVSFSEDLAIPGEDVLQEHQYLGGFLTGNVQSENVLFIDTPDAVHDMYIANPAEVAKAIESCPDELDLISSR